jgi:hypothetical protein
MVGSNLHAISWAIVSHRKADPSKDSVLKRVQKLIGDV